MNRKRLSTNDRIKVYEKYDGRCAYCGKKIEYKDMQVDHLEAYWKGGADEMSNYMPSCRQCNHYKRGNSLEGFRKLIEEIPVKLNRDSYIFRVGLLYGNVYGRTQPIEFYFEKVKKGNNNDR